MWSQLLSLEITKKTIAAKNSLIKQRYLIDVVKDNIAFCRNLIEVVGVNNSNFRHSDEVEANFVVSEKEYLGSITLKEKASPTLLAFLLSPLRSKTYDYAGAHSRKTKRKREKRLDLHLNTIAFKEEILLSI